MKSFYILTIIILFIYCLSSGQSKDFLLLLLPLFFFAAVSKIVLPKYINKTIKYNIKCFFLRKKSHYSDFRYCLFVCLFACLLGSRLRLKPSHIASIMATVGSLLFSIFKSFRRIVLQCEFVNANNITSIMNWGD